MNVIPENILSKMDPADRATLPKNIRLTAKERRARAEEKTEREMHKYFVNWLSLHSNLFQAYHADPTKRPRIESGLPDFAVIYRNRLGQTASVCFIEFKVPGGRLTESQKRKFTEFAKAHIDVFIVTSFEDAIAQVTESFQIPQEILNG